MLEGTTEQPPGTILEPACRQLKRIGRRLDMSDSTFKAKLVCEITDAEKFLQFGFPSIRVR
jgi:hypothetical protein